MENIRNIAGVRSTPLHTANLGKHVGLSLLVALALTFFGCGGDGGGGSGGSGGSGSDGEKGNNINNYKTATIGDQVWMAENLNYNVDGSWCYNDSAAYCKTYGRLYDWATAMALPSECNSSACADQIQEKHQGICPNGWHIPTEDEWNILINFIDDTIGNTYSQTAGKHLKATSGWSGGGNGLDTYKFAALPGGNGISAGSITWTRFSEVGEYGYWLSATSGGSSSYQFYMSSGFDGTNNQSPNKRSSLLSLRCLKD